MVRLCASRIILPDVPLKFRFVIPRFTLTITFAPDLRIFNVVILIILLPLIVQAFEFSVSVVLDRYRVCEVNDPVLEKLEPIETTVLVAPAEGANVDAFVRSPPVLRLALLPRLIVPELDVFPATLSTIFAFN